jgi:N-acetyl-gamma-glutamyl-phosphate reductase
VRSCCACSPATPRSRWRSSAHSQAGTPVADLFPNLLGTRTFDAVDAEALAELDVVVLATPHGAALELGAELHDAGTRVVDLSAAFRLSAAGFATWYGEPHPRPDLAAGDPQHVATVAYGMPELHREAIAAARLVANPGCYPTATLLGLAPLAPLLVGPGTVVVDAKSGTSGAGRAAQGPPALRSRPRRPHRLRRAHPPPHR